MERDFTKEVNRLNTNSVKWDLMEKEGKTKGTIPMWVADMDFQVPVKVQEAIEKVAKHGVYGYSFCPDSYYEAVINWYRSRFGFEFVKEDILTTPGIVTAVAMAIRAYTNEGDCVLIQNPVYYPFRMMIERNGRKVVNNPLVNVEGRYIMDISDFEKKIVDENVKLFILCNPHNPVGRVWTREELVAISEICEKHHVLVLSDEIHGDFVYDDRKQHPFATVKDTNRQFTITCTAPSKTFNLAGLQTSNIIIPNKELREKFQKELDAASIGMISPMGIAACEAAYTYGAQWLEELKATIVKNRDFMQQFIEDHLPELTMSELEGTYLAWVDMSGLAMTNEELKTFIAEKAKIWVDDGDMFGKEGENFARFNLACPLSTVEKAMKQLEDAVLARYN
ncbi:MAG: pyridoxal phosphate-dependent aminotransferase [Lachnospiraceae bacterium]|nr:pyridoxal phosphate-dependent aminotransferase [Lachnospiraceae bacterium]